MTRNMFGTTKDVHKIQLNGYLNQPAVDLFSKNVSYLWVVDRYRNDLEPRGGQIFRDKESRLVRLRLSFDSENCDGSYAGK